MKYLKCILLFFVCMSLFSCLESGLEDLPSYEDADIKAFTFEYRWMVKEGDSEKLRVQKMDADIDINVENTTVTCNITVPAVNGTFTQEIRNQVTLSNLNAYCTISTAATITPIGDTPMLGKIGDFSKSDMQYEVIAADGNTTKTWKLVIDGFNK